MAQEGIPRWGGGMEQLCDEVGPGSGFHLSPEETQAIRHGAAQISAGKIVSGEPRNLIAGGGAFPWERG